MSELAKKMLSTPSKKHEDSNLESLKRIPTRLLHRMRRRGIPPARRIFHQGRRVVKSWIEGYMEIDV